MAQLYNRLYNLPVIGLRFFTVYGPRQRPEMAIHKFAQLMHDGESIPMFGDGSTARDYTYIDDIISGVLAAEANCNSYHIYNLGNSKTVPLHDLIEKIGRAMNLDYNIKKLPMQPGDVNITFADIHRAQEELGYDPKTTIDSGLERFVQGFRENSA